MNKKDASTRREVLFINADREYREGKAQNFLRPEDISKIVDVYRARRDVPGYARLVSVSEIEAEDYNCNIRRYVDNAPPPEPHDVRAHLQGGVPASEIDALARFWGNYIGLRERCFIPRADDPHYADFSDAICSKRDIAEVVKTDPGIAASHGAFMETLEDWWKRNLPLIEALAPTNGRQGNVYALRRALVSDINETFEKQTLLNEHQVRGALARYIDDLKADLKSVAASGWGAELIPDAEILASQFPELLEEMEQKRLRLAELSALFAAADEEDYEDADDSGVLPGEEVRSLKAELKETNAQAKLAKREKREAADFLTRAAEITAVLQRHKTLEDESKTLKSALRATEKRQAELVEAARAKINDDEARRVILARLHRLLTETYEGYLRADQRACVAAVENLHAKYAVTSVQIETERDAAVARLKAYLSELGYE